MEGLHPPSRAATSSLPSEPRGLSAPTTDMIGRANLSHLERQGQVFSPRHVARNVRLLVGAATQHLQDDPALLPVQVSRRLPLRIRRGIGEVFLRAGTSLPAGSGVAALGAVMSGDDAAANALLETEPRSTSRLRDEVAVISDRADLLRGDSSAPVRARAAWSAGDLSGAVGVLEREGMGATAQARRFRSELRMLDLGYSLVPRPSGAGYLMREPGQPLCVLHLLTNSLPHTQSGYAVRTHNILTALDRHGIESVALTRTGYPVMVGKPFCADEDVVDGVRYCRSLPSRLGDTPQERLEQEVDEALRIVEHFRPHVIHATTDFRNALVAQAVSASTGIPWILEVRGLMEKTWIASHREGRSRDEAARSEKVEKIMAKEGELARLAHAVVTLSRGMARELEGRGVSPDRIVLVPNAVDETLLDERMTPQQARKGISERIEQTALAVGAVSALVDYEGFDTLLEAAAMILDDEGVPEEIRGGLQVVLVGDGVSAPKLREQARRLGIEDRVLLPGRVPREDAKRWVQALDVVVVPRKDLEVSRTVTPQKPVEAMALGRPVVVSDLPALRETVEGTSGEIAGVLVPPDDPARLAETLVDLLGDSLRREDLAQAGRAAAADRTWGAMMRRYESAYLSVLREADKEAIGGE